MKDADLIEIAWFDPEFVELEAAGGDVTVDMSGVLATAVASGIATYQEVIRVAPGVRATANATGIATYQEVIRVVPGVRAIANAFANNPANRIVRVPNTFAIARGVANPSVQFTVRALNQTFALANATAISTFQERVKINQVAPAGTAIATASGIATFQELVRIAPPSAIANASAIPGTPLTPAMQAVPAIANATATVPVIRARVTAVRSSALGIGTNPTKLTVRVVAPVAIARVSAIGPVDNSAPGGGIQILIRRRPRIKVK